MNLLLDTHVAIWAIVDDPRLPAKVRDLILAPENSIFVSAVSVWEIAIKHPLARRGIGAMPVSARQAEAYFREAGYALLSITPTHAVPVEDLPRLHPDPFDRLLVAQALAERLRLLTHDAAIAAYDRSIIAF